MPKALIAEPSLNPSLLALKPRQLLISTPLMGKQSKTLSLESEQKALLLRSIAQYLDRSGFSKCFKKLLSEAEIEKKELNSELPDLEQVFLEFLKKKNQEAVEVKDKSGDAEDGKKKAGSVDEDASDDNEKVTKNEATENAVEVVEKVKKEKKKKKKEAKLEVTEEEEKVKEADAEIEDGQKEKKKKKKEAKLEVTEEEEKVKDADAEIEEGQKEKKKKKKKSKSVEAESLADDDKEKVSKKRKRSEPEEKKDETEDDEESKRRKKEENVEDDEGVQETPVKQTQVEENGNVEKSEKKSTNQKSGKGLSNSKEPKVPFQRVKVDEVVITDDRLKDNSYWAKDGADSGYGAKAQEILGQVKGRGFRHEKTKKKRGSYRGGEIDLQSHSVKFEYSDDE